MVICSPRPKAGMKSRTTVRTSPKVVPSVSAAVAAVRPQMSKEDGLVPIRNAAAVAVPPIRGVLQCLPAADRRIGDAKGARPGVVSGYIGDQRIVGVVDNHRVLPQAPQRIPPPVGH